MTVSSVSTSKYLLIEVNALLKSLVIKGLNEYFFNSLTTRDICRI